MKSSLFMIYKLREGSVGDMTKDEWKKVEEKMKRLHDIVELQCDPYKVKLVLSRISQFKNGILVFVNEQIKGEWLLNECEERRRFYRKITKSLGMKKSQKELFKKMSKRLQKEIMADRKYSYYSEYWTSFNSLKRHFIKENGSIELIKKE
jgi:hypothetical protein